MLFQEMKDYVITVNKKAIPVSKKEVEGLDMVAVSGTDFHLLRNNQGYGIRLLRADYLNKKLVVSVNGNTYELTIEDAYDQRVQEMGLLAAASQEVNSIKAPMPGLIVDIMVVEGQEISEGSPLLILSAMKMENIILSQGMGTVKTIAVKKDDAVEKGQLIIEME